MDARNIPQPMRPHGLQGRLFGFLMERLSATNYRWVVAQLKPRKPKRYLEIGFGTGKLAQMVARKLRPQRIAGVDPAPLMVATARKKLGWMARKIAIALEQGDDTHLATLEGPFDAIVATHCFQFWADPAATLARIHALLAPDGILVLVLRQHITARVAPFIPNPITRSGDELAGIGTALRLAGFRIVADERFKTNSQGLAAVKA